MITIESLAEDGSTIIVDELRGHAKAQQRLKWLRREDPSAIYFLL